MSKVKNQELFSTALYGGELANDKLHLESSTNAVKGAVELEGATFDLIIGGQIGSIVHANTATRTYALPDFDGTLLAAGIFTATGQMLYASAPSTSAVLAPSVDSVLASDPSGIPLWLSGSEGDFVQILAGVPVFASLPAEVGTIADSTPGQEIPIYDVPGNDLIPLVTVSERSLTSVAGVLAWTLISAPLLSGPAGVPLTTGTLGQFLTSQGNNNFDWTTPNPSNIVASPQFALPFYSLAGTDQEVTGSSFLFTDEINKTLQVTDANSIRFFEATGNGVAYIELAAPAAVAASVSFTLPPADSVANAVLRTDGAGNLFFSALTNGMVNAALINQVAFYANNGNEVNGVTTVSNRSLLSPAGVPTWGLLTAPYLSTTGNVPLSNGMLNQVLISEANGNFLWIDVQDLNGEVLGGIQNALAFYNAIGTTVQGSNFISQDAGARQLNLKDGGQLRLHQALIDGIFTTSLQANPLQASDLLFTLPVDVGLAGQMLTTDGVGNLSWDNTAFEKRGSITVALGAKQSTVVFEAPFLSTPEMVTIAWDISAVTSGAVLPVIVINNLGPEGFTASFSGTASGTGVYRVHWNAYRFSDASPPVAVFIAGGANPALQTTILQLNVDNDTAAVTTPANFAAARAHASASSDFAAGRILGGIEVASSVDRVSSFIYATSTIIDTATNLLGPRSGAAGIGTKADGFTAGGENTATSTLTSIEKLSHATDTVTSVAFSLNNNALNRGACNSGALGFIVHSVIAGSVDIFNFASEAIAAGSTSFAVDNVEVGCNDITGALGYFGRENGNLFAYGLQTNTITLLAPNLASVTGLSSAANSFSAGYFAGATLIEALDFSTGTVTVVNMLPTINNVASAGATFQTGGLQ